jgi:putative transposase
LLHELATATRTAIHAYVLMGNHVHLLLTPADSEVPSSLMHDLGLRYTRYFNRKHQRTGSLWEGRFWAAPVASDAYILACHRYIELNPVRAGLVAIPCEYGWSSHRANIGGESSRMLTRHPSLEALGTTKTAAVRAYADLFNEPLDIALVGSLRAGLESGPATQPVPGSNPVPVSAPRGRW